MYRMNLRILRIFVILSLVILTACGKDSPTDPNPTQPPPPPPVPTRIVIDPSSVTLDAIGQTSQLTAQVFDQNNALMTGAVVSWTSSDTGVATVDVTGEVTAVGNGSASITARSGSASGIVNVTVMQTAHDITIEPQMATLTAIGETVQLTATVLDRNEQPVAGIAVTWSSSDSGVATVDDEGLVTAFSSGDTRITASHSGLSASVQIEVDIADPDRETLITLYNALGGPNWTHRTNWLSGLPLGAWHGVETDENGSVTKLELGFNNLSGSIPAELGNLTNLQELNLSLNGLSGSIPPELGNLSNLQELDLSENELSCIIPPELGNLTNLRRLSIYSTPIIPAIFPPSWDPVPNPLCGIPLELGNLTNLQELRLGYSELSGSIPSELGNLANLQELHLGLNKLSGGIPQELGNLANLQQLDLGLNELSGSIPPALGNLSELTYLALYFNEDLAGPLPDTFTSLDNLQALFLYSTGLCVPPDAAFQAWLERTQAVPEMVYCEAM